MVARPCERRARRAAGPPTASAATAGPSGSRADVAPPGWRRRRLVAVEPEEVVARPPGDAGRPDRSFFAVTLVSTLPAAPPRTGPARRR